jgi:hypothetical protein
VQGPNDVQGRSTAITVVTPVRRWWALWLRADWAALAVLKLALRQRGPSRPVRRLSFISFAHWALVDSVPAHGRGRSLRLRRRRRRPLPHPYVLFHSNFNGAAHEYFEAFTRGLTIRMRGLWAGAYDIPDPGDLTAFSRYIADRWAGCDHYYAAYPQASTKMVLAALELERRFGDFATRAAELEPEEFEREYERFLSSVQRYL